MQNLGESSNINGRVERVLLIDEGGYFDERCPQRIGSRPDEASWHNEAVVSVPRRSQFDGV